MTAEQATKISKEQKPIAEKSNFDRELSEIYSYIEYEAYQGNECVDFSKNISIRDDVFNELIKNGFLVLRHVNYGEPDQILWGNSKLEYESYFKRVKEEREKYNYPTKKWYQFWK